MAIKNIAVENGFLVITDENARKTSLPYLTQLAQILTALIRILIERGIIEDTPLISKDGADISLDVIFDALTTMGAIYEDERKYL